MTTRTTPRIRLSRSLALLLMSACVDDYNPSVVSSRQLMAEQEIQAGGTVDVAVQFLDKQGRGANEVECLFVVSHPDVLRFAESTETSWLRVRSKRDEVAGAELEGVARAQLRASPVEKPVDVTLWAGSTCRDDLAEDAESTAGQFWKFTIHVQPSDADAGVSGP